METMYVQVKRKFNMRERMNKWELWIFQQSDKIKGLGEENADRGELYCHWCIKYREAHIHRKSTRHPLAAKAPWEIDV